MFIEAAPGYIVDVPLIWQHIGEILGTFSLEILIAFSV